MKPVAALLSSILLCAGTAARGQAPACPAAHMPAPDHPSVLLRENLQGRVVVAVRLDDCGRVLDASVAETAGHEALDTAALAAVRRWVFPAVHRQQAKDGRLKVPVKFDTLRDVETQALHWPRSHRRARYLADTEAIGFPTLEAVSETVQTPENLMASPYVRKRGSVLDPGVPEPGGFYRSAAGGEPVYWLSFLRWNDFGESRAGQLRPREVAVARYRLVFEDGEPIVRVALLCEDAAPQCDYIRQRALRRLPVR